MTRPTVSWRFDAALVRTDPPTPPQLIRLSRWTPEQYLRQLGVGGWVEDRHARAKSTTRWEGTPLHRVTLDLHLDAVRRQRGAPTPPDVEQDLATLHRWGLPVDPADPMSEPPKIQVRYSYGQQIRWVVNDLAPRSFTLDPDTGRRVQADITLELMEHRAARLALSPVEAAAQTPTSSSDTPPASGGSRTYTVRPGDTLTSIAARELGAAARWTEIYALNSPPASNLLLSGPDLIVAGQVLAMPSA